MRINPSRLYTWIASLGLFLQGASTLLALMLPAIDRAVPALLRETQMIPSHSLLHITSGLVGLAALRFGGAVGPRGFALAFGLFYVALALAGALSGAPLGLGLKPFDHSLHATLGGAGLLAVALDVINSRAALRSNR